MGEMKPCPHCGQVQIEIHYIGIPSRLRMAWAVQCHSCWARGPAAVSKELALEAWNRRPIKYENLRAAISNIRELTIKAPYDQVEHDSMDCYKYTLSQIETLTCHALKGDK